jgi:hypothetical protein
MSDAVSLWDDMHSSDCMWCSINFVRHEMQSPVMIMMRHAEECRSEGGGWMDGCSRNNYRMMRMNSAK